MPSRRGDVLVGPARRRRWPLAEKLEIVKESREEGAIVSHVAQRHGISPQQLFGWRRAIREQVLGTCGPECEIAANDLDFVPISIAKAALAPTAVSSSEKVTDVTRPSSIKIELPATRIRLTGSVDARSLATVLKALKVLG
ncbi:MAG: transposase [Hyphomicrobiaceae bacterium]